MSDRAVSEVISYVLVFSLIVSAVGLVSISGLASLQETRDAEQIQNAERAFDVLADNVADIHQRGAPSRATEISLGENQLYTDDNVTMRVEIDNDVDSDFDYEDSWRIRPIVYSGSEERRLVYEAGAVFRTNRDSEILIREPPFIIENDRILIPVVGINRPNAQSLGGSTVLVRTKLQERTTGLANPDNTTGVDKLNVTIIDSPRQDQWQAYFENSGFENCSEPNTNELTCKFVPDTGTIDRVYIVYHDISVNIDP